MKNQEDKIHSSRSSQGCKIIFSGDDLERCKNMMLTRTKKPLKRIFIVCTVTPKKWCLYANFIYNQFVDNLSVVKVELYKINFLIIYLLSKLNSQNPATTTYCHKHQNLNIFRQLILGATCYGNLTAMHVGMWAFYNQFNANTMKMFAHSMLCLHKKFPHENRCTKNIYRQR